MTTSLRERLYKRLEEINMENEMQEVFEQEDRAREREDVRDMMEAQADEERQQELLGDLFFLLTLAESRQMGSSSDPLRAAMNIAKALGLESKFENMNEG